ncbi:DUF3800 domain-containing protein [Bradyrhizobium algeriense]|uniref:DUF3800 domain-containing protein n=1 Tax=Bradyrhizobium algeriense TaxID=634784 RepID=UPI000D33E8B6|nr:DUF3800 domain-containing protein [Bradyrhizobium algeriense]
MITAYFDDSGTHGERADIVLVAGIFGTEARMDNLDRNWKRHLDSPLCGRKDPIKRFHAYDCDNSVGEFLRWTRTETDYFRLQLRNAIIESDVAAYGLACRRKDWEEIITGDLRKVLGTPEGFCINQCFVRSVRWVKANTFDPHMTFVFDHRPDGVQRYTGAVYDAFELHTKPPPQLTGYAFLNSTKVRPLQAADLVAWELYRHANSIFKHGANVLAQKEVLHLQRNMDFEAQITARENIIEIRDFWLNHFKENPGYLEQFANHFSSFDPRYPDYENLSDKQSS